MENTTMTEVPPDGTVDRETWILLAPVFKEAMDLMTKSERGKRGTLWMDMSLEDLISFLHTKVLRLRANTEDRDSAIDAMNYAAMIAWRIKEGEWE
jgi:hypothetical protein